MDRRTILKATTCDLTQLPLGSRAAFVLSQLDGQLTLEEVAEVVGIELDEVFALAQNLVEVGAVNEVAATPRGTRRTSVGKVGVAVDRVASTGRIDPRAESSFTPPASSTKKRSERPKATPTAARRPSKSMRSASRRMNAVAAQAQKPVEAPTPVKGSAGQVTAVIARAPASPAPAPEIKPAATTLIAGSNATIAEKVERLRAGALEVKIQGQVDALVKAAEDALRVNDVVSAANNYRLALSHRDDPHLRMKFEEVDGRAKVVRFEKNIAPARAAEKEQRWADAAVFFERAHEAKPDPDVAAAAANALRLSGGDLRRATTLAEQAVARDESNVAYRIVLAEVHLAANRLESAREASAGAAALAPKDTRVRDLAAALAERGRRAKA